MVMAKVMTIIISSFTLGLVTGSGLYCVLLFGICFGRREIYPCDEAAGFFLLTII
jgi:hypothetical protein